MLPRLPGGLWDLGTPQEAVPAQGGAMAVPGQGAVPSLRSWWGNKQSWGKSHLPTLTGALQPHGNSPPACDYPSSSWWLFVPMTPAGDRLGSGRARREPPNVFPHWHWFCGDLHLGESTSKNVVFAPILDDGFVPKHLRGWSRRTQCVRNAQERTQTSCFLANKLFGLIRTFFLS